MPTQVLMPALSPTMEEGTLAKWLVSEGQEIKAGDVIAEIETDKATMEVEAVDEGRLAKILVPAGTENVKVNTPIALIEGEDESADQPQKAPASTKAAPADRLSLDGEGGRPSAAKATGRGEEPGEPHVAPGLSPTPNPSPASMRSMAPP